MNLLAWLGPADGRRSHAAGPYDEAKSRRRCTVVHALRARLSLLLLAALLPQLPAGAPTGVGILYNVNTVQAAQAQAAVMRLGAPPLTTELVIRSDGALTLDDVYGRGLALNLTNSSLLF